MNDKSQFELEDALIPLLIRSVRPLTLGLWNILKRLWTRLNKTPDSVPPYSFDGPRLVHPLIVRELIGWISDSGQEIVAVDIDRAIGSNRFFFDEELKTRTYEGKQWVESGRWNEFEGFKERETYGYQYIATSPSGIEMLLFYDSGGGSATFYSVVFLSFEDDSTLTTEITDVDTKTLKREAVTRRRTLLKIVGCLLLGDKYKGKIEYKNGSLTIGPDEGWYRRGEETTARLRVK